MWGFLLVFKQYFVYLFYVIFSNQFLYWYYHSLMVVFFIQPGLTRANLGIYMYLSVLFYQPGTKIARHRKPPFNGIFNRISGEQNVLRLYMATLRYIASD